MLSRARVLAALSIVIASLLTACSNDVEPERPKIGSVIEARTTAFEPVGDAFLVYPGGRLDIEYGKPTKELSETQTALLNAEKAPTDAVFLPLSWHLDGDYFNDYDTYFGPELGAKVAIVVNGESYELPPPFAQRAGAKTAMFVALPDDASTVEFTLEYAGVTQTLDLVKKTRKPGPAKSLYTLPTRARPDSITCDTAKWDLPEDTNIGITCAVSDPLQLPFVDGQWASAKHTYVAVTVVTNLYSYVRFNDNATAAYVVVGSTSDIRLGGKKPTSSLDPQEKIGANVDVLVFDVTGKVPTDLEVRRDYRLDLLSVTGKISAPPEIKADIGGNVEIGS